MTRAGLALAVLLLPALTACGPRSGEHEGTPAITVVARAGEVTTAAGTARVSMTLEGESGGGETTGVVDMQARKAALTMRVAGRGHPGVSFELRVLGSTAYAQTSVHEDEWYELDLDEPATGGFVERDPTDVLAHFRGVADDVRRLGSEKVRGVATTRYEGTVDLDKALAAASGAQADAVRKFRTFVGVTTVPTHLWVDREGRLRRLRQTYDGSKIQGAKMSGTVTLTVEMWDFGVPVDVQAPPAHQVYEAPSVTPSPRPSRS